MRVEQILNTKVSSLTIPQLRSAIITMKATANKQIKAFEQHQTPLSEKLAALDENLAVSKAAQKPLYKMNQQELRSVLTMYQHGLGKDEYIEGPDGKVRATGRRVRAVSSSYSGYVQAEKKREKRLEKVYSGYKQLSPDQRKDFWVKYRRLLAMNPEVIRQYGSDVVIEQLQKYNIESNKDMDAQQMYHAMLGFLGAKRQDDDIWRISVAQAKKGRNDFDIARIILKYEQSDLSKIGNSLFFEQYEGAIGELEESIARYFI